MKKIHLGIEKLFLFFQEMELGSDSFLKRFLPKNLRSILKWFFKLDEGNSIVISSEEYFFIWLHRLLISNLFILILFIIYSLYNMHLVTQISTMYHCNISCNLGIYYQKYDQFLPSKDFENFEISQIWVEILTPNFG